MFNIQISAIFYRLTEKSLYVSLYTVVVVVVFSKLVSLAWPAACLRRERSSTIALHVGWEARRRLSAPECMYAPSLQPNTPFDLVS